MSEYSITVNRIVEQEAVVVIDTEDGESIEDLTAMAIESLDEYDWEIIKVLETKDF